jgi:hypothetical protein
MKRTCLQKNTNTDEQNTCEFHPAENLLEEHHFNPKDIQQVKSFVWMKSLLKALFLSIYVCCTFHSNAQTLISENKVWIQVVYKLPSFTAVTEYLKIKGDTLINKLNYKKVFQSFDKNQKLWNKYGYIRENWDQKVYYRSDTSKLEYLFYDFAVQLNDTIQLTTIKSYNNKSEFRNITFIVNNIDSVLIDNDYRKKIQLSNSKYPDSKNFYEYFIEGIGSLSGLLYWDDVFSDYDNYDLICFLENNIFKFHDEKFPTCYYKYPSTSINYLNEDNKLIETILFDNGALQIHTLRNSLGELRLFNANGELFLKQEINSPETQICLPQSGIFIYQFISEKNEVQTGKVMVK